MEQIWLADLLKPTVLLLHDHTSVSKNKGLAKHNAEKIKKNVQVLRQLNIYAVRPRSKTSNNLFLKYFTRK